jgi:hypothetical protein
MLSCLVSVVLAWGPVFHQVVAEEFAQEYLPHLSAEARRAFILGSIYIDGLPEKGKSHDIEWILRLCNAHNDTKEEWWFLIGCALHLTVDTAGHQGHRLSYLPLRRPFHYLAELVVCSMVRRDRNPVFLEHDHISDAIFQQVAGKSSANFDSLHRFWRFLSGLPFHKMLGWIESDKCAFEGRSVGAEGNLEIHMNMIKGLMWDSLCLIMTGEMNRQKLAELVLKDLEDLQC